MKPVRDKEFAHIEITNRCPVGDCVYCSRFERHLRPDMLYEMDLDFIDKCLESYRGFPNRLGLLGGEPQLHTKFPEICELIRSKYPKEKMALWTSISPLGKNKEAIASTFSFIAFNEHSAFQLMVCEHQPLTLAAKDMVEDGQLRNMLIEDCWIGKNWCSTITPLGAYFCEVAASIAYLQGIKGWEVEPGWWMRSDYEDQIELCQMCGGSVPMKRQLICDKKQRISPSFYRMLINNHLPIGDYELVERPFTKEDLAEAAKGWRPGAYRADIGGIEGLGSTLNWKEIIAGE